MALSMTGCGEGRATDGPSACRVEVRTVNNRFFKFSLRSREGFSAFESRIEAVVRERIRRGAVQMTLDISGPAAPGMRRFDRQQIETYLDDLEDFCSTHDIPVPRTIDALLSLPGVLVESSLTAAELENTWPLVRSAVDEALARLEAMRRAEGEALSRDMRAICGEVRGLATVIRARVPAVVEEHRGRLYERVKKLLEGQAATLSPADLAREVALLADRSDIAEELVRLESHVEQFERLLGEDSPGRSLDFLSQELAREANTIGSKSPDVAIAHTVVELKTRIERLREQVQNIE